MKRKKKYWYTLCGIIFMAALLPKAVWADDLGSITMEAAGEFQDGIAPILFQYYDYDRDDNETCLGYIDKTGKLLFYINCDGISTDWPYNDGYELEDADYTNYLNGSGYLCNEGYIWIDYYGQRYIIDSSGNIVSSYLLDNIMCSGEGYTWIREESGKSWKDEGHYVLSLYDPEGREVSQDILNHEQGENCEIQYLGDNIFGKDGYEEAYYSVAAEKWFKTGSIENTQILFFDRYGKLNVVNVPKAYWSWGDYVRWVDSSSRYILFGEEIQAESLALYDMREEIFSTYCGEYLEFIRQGTENEQVSENSFVFEFVGADDEDYIGLIDARSMKETCDPIPAGERDFSLRHDILTVEYDVRKEVYDMYGTLMLTLPRDDDVIVGEDCIAVCSRQYGDFAYYDHVGILLFDQIDASQAVNLADSM